MNMGQPVVYQALIDANGVLQGFETSSGLRTYVAGIVTDINGVAQPYSLVAGSGGGGGGIPTGSVAVAVNSVTGVVTQPTSTPIVGPWVPRTGTEATLLSTVGSTGELGSATDVPAIVQFVGGSTPGGYVTYPFDSVIAYTSTAVAGSTLIVAPTSDVARITAPSAATSLAVTLSNGYLAGQRIALEFVSSPAGLASITINGTTVAVTGAVSSTGLPPSASIGSGSAYGLVFEYTGAAWNLVGSYPMQAFGPGAVALGPGSNPVGGLSLAALGGTVYGYLAAAFGQATIYGAGSIAFGQANVYSDGSVAIGQTASATALSVAVAIADNGIAHGAQAVAIGGTAGNQLGATMVSAAGSYSNISAGATNFTVVGSNVAAKFEVNDIVLLANSGGGSLVANSPTLLGIVTSSTYTGGNTVIGISISTTSYPAVLNTGRACTLFNLMDGQFSFALGTGSFSHNLGDFIYSQGYNNALGDMQFGLAVFGAQTTAATGVVACSQGNFTGINTNTAPGSSNRFIPDKGKAYRLHCSVIARDVTSATAAGVFAAGFTMVVNNVNGTLSVLQTPTSDGSTASATGTLSAFTLGGNVAGAANATYQSLDFTLTGKASTTIDWTVTILRAEAA